MMRRFFSKLLVLVAVFSIVTATTPRRSEALLLWAIPADKFDGFRSSGLWLCLILLPLCVLDEKAEVKQLTHQDLLDNGYTREQISNIQSGQEKVVRYMNEHGMSKAAEMPKAIEAVKPELNQDYLQFIKEVQ